GPSKTIQRKLSSGNADNRSKMRGPMSTAMAPCLYVEYWAKTVIQSNCSEGLFRAHFDKCCVEYECQLSKPEQEDQSI
ncbi:MAG: hypothetical protein P8M25_04390, partial [Paracoccaceae bacterium]|nr:hypothetical protein [Paracoccaceae bacterium]